MFDAVLREWKRNVTDVFIYFRGKRVRDWRHPVWKSCCTYVRKFVNGRLRTNYDLHYVNPVYSDGGSADVAFYVTKYMLKPSSREERLQQALKLNLEPEEYDDVWNCVKSRHFESEALGLGQCVKEKRFGRLHYVVHPLVLEHLRNGITLSKSLGDDSYPRFVGPVDGKLFPLADYYIDNPDIYTMQDFLDFFYRSDRRPDNVVIRDIVHPSQILKRFDDFDRKVSSVSFNQTANELDDLFDENL